VVLSDESIREEIESGGIVIEPLGDDALQPSSVDLRVDRFFRVFRNDTTPYIDPKKSQEDLTELVEVKEGDAFILHPGEFVLGTTLERVALGRDLVARLEGKSSLGRLGLLIHSSLPASERVMVYSGGRLQPRPIGEVVGSKLRGSVVSFDPESFEVGYHQITGWYERPPDRIYEVRLASGRRVRVTAGHNLFSLDADGRITKVRTGELRAGMKVAIPRVVPDAPQSQTEIRLLELMPEEAYEALTCSGPSVAAQFELRPKQTATLLRDAGFRHVAYYRSRSCLPMGVARLLPDLLERLGAQDRFAKRGSTGSLPAVFQIDLEIAWLLGLYLAEGSFREGQFTISNTDQTILDQVERILGRFDFNQYRSDGKITGCSGLFAWLLEWLGTGRGAHSKRVPPLVFGWDRSLIESFFDGLVDGDGSRDPQRTSVWTCSNGLAGDVLLLAERLGKRAGSSLRKRGKSQLWQIYLPNQEHELLASVPLPHRLLIEVRNQAGLDQVTASRLAGYRHPTDLCNIENRSGRDAVRLATLRRLRSAYARRPQCRPSLRRLDRLIEGGLLWDEVAEIRDTGEAEPVFDLEVRPGGRKVENFLAGSGGVFVSNTAGFVDAGWDGHLTLELSNVANLPIAIYPGMKIGQISFLRMTTEASLPYGSEETRSKYQGQRGPTPSRYYLNFPQDETPDPDHADTE
jgi:deoxycytidine triphosphate deaminase/intein/homing endonuclease